MGTETDNGTSYGSWLKSEIADFVDSKDHLKKLVLDSLPIFIYSFASNLILTFNLRAIGMYGDSFMLAGVGLGSTWLMATNFIAITAMNIGTLTLCSQALGAKEYRLAGLTLHRAIVLRLIMFIPGYLLLFVSENMFILWGADPQVAAYAGTYCKYQFVPVVFFIFFDTIKSILLANGIFMPFLYIQICATFAHFCFCNIFVPMYGIAGACYAMSLTYMFSLALLCSYIVWKKPCEESFFKPEAESFTKLLPQFKQELPIGSTVYLECVAFESTVMIAGQFPAVELSAQVVAFNVAVSAFQAILGLVMVVTSTLANAIGEKDYVKAGKIRKAALFYVTIVLCIETPTIFVCKEQIIRFFTSDPEVIVAAKPIIAFFAFVTVGDYIQAANCAMLRAVGKEHLGLKINVVSFYCVGIPIGYVLGALFGWYGVGMWIGLTIGIYSGFLMSVKAWFDIDFKEQILFIERRLQESKALEEKLLEKNEHAIELKQI